MSWTPNEIIRGQRARSSPALAEYAGLLHMVHPGESSTNIWHSVFDGSAWSTNTRLVGQQSKAPSTLAEYDNRLHLVHLDRIDNKLWHSSFDGQRWTTNAQIPGARAHSAPALAAYGGLLHLVHNGDTSNGLFHLTFNGQGWTTRPPDPALDAQRSKGAVALAPYNGRLHMVHQGDTSNNLWHSTFDGVSWTANVPIPGQLSRSAAALAVMNNRLQLVHLGDSSDSLWHSAFDGNTWIPNEQIPHQFSSSAPALCEYAGRLHMVHTGQSDETLWHSTSDGLVTNKPTRRVVVIDIDGCRWDTLYRHLKRVRDAGASTTTTYQFQLPAGATTGTILGGGGSNLHSGLAELCLAPSAGMVDVRLALSSYPTFTFPAHATMYTGAWPGGHGVTGHKFVVRDAPPEWDWHQWDEPPRAIALEGFCTGAESGVGVGADWFWNGLDEVSEDSCRNRNRGLNSDLRVQTMFETAEAAGKRTCAIHALYHGATRPWDSYGKDQWWHYSNPEMRSYKDICTDEDADQHELVDHGTFSKAEVLLSAMPSTVSVGVGPFSDLVGLLFDPLNGTRSAITYSGDPHPDGPPDLIALYLSSIDNASHIEGLRNQETYLAWFDHRLARFVRELRAVDPAAFNNTIFAIVADHGHAAITNPPATAGLLHDDTALVRQELVRIVTGSSSGTQVTSNAVLGYEYSSLLQDLIDDQIIAFHESMNLYVYIRDTGTFPTLDVAKRLLSNPMNTVPYGALVLMGNTYEFLGRGETQSVAIDSAAARASIVPRLDPPPVNTAEIDAVSLTSADATAERQLRTALNTAAAFDLLRVKDRVEGLQPDGHRSMPDIILLAPEGQSFSDSPSTHGSFAASTSRIPMIFCGPGIPAGRVTLDSANLTDFAPTVLALLGLSATGTTGTALLDINGRPTAPTRPNPPLPTRGTIPTVTAPTQPRSNPVIRAKTLTPPARLVLNAHHGRTATAGELASSLPAYAAIKIVPPVRQPGVRAAPMRKIETGDAISARIDAARALANPSAHLWLERHGERTNLGRRRNLEVPEHGEGILGSASSTGVIQIPSRCLIVPITLTLTRTPRWLQRSMDELRHTHRVAITAGTPIPAIVDRLLLTLAEFEQLVASLRLMLDDAQPTRVNAAHRARPLPAPNVNGTARTPYERIQDGVTLIRPLLKAKKAARLTLPNTDDF